MNIHLRTFPDGSVWVFDGDIPQHKAQFGNGSAPIAAAMGPEPADQVRLSDESLDQYINRMPRILAGYGDDLPPNSDIYAALLELRSFRAGAHLQQGEIKPRALSEPIAVANDPYSAAQAMMRRLRLVSSLDSNVIKMCKEAAGLIAEQVAHIGRQRASITSLQRKIANQKKSLRSPSSPKPEAVSDAALERLTRPIIGISNRSALEVFDIMSDRIRAALSTNRSETP